MSNWKEVEFKEIADIVMGQSPTGDTCNTNGNGVPLLNGPTEFTRKYPKPIQYTIDARKLSKQGDVLFCVRGSTTGRMNWSDKEYAIGRGLAAIRHKYENRAQYFIKAILDCNLPIILGGATGSTFPNVSREELNNLKILVPDIKVQISISEVLSSIDDKIDLLHRQSKTLEQLGETLFRQWFVEEVDDSWEVEKLEQLFDIGIGRTPPRKESQWFSTDTKDVKWVSIKDMGTSGIYIDTTAEFLTKEAIEKFSIPIIPLNTVLLSFKMTIGRLAITTEEMLSNEAIAHFKNKQDSNLYPEYLYLFLKTFRWQQLGSTSSIVDAINSQMIREIELIVPAKIKLDKFYEIIKPNFEKIKANQKQIRTLSELRNTLLPKLMNGDVNIID